MGQEISAVSLLYSLVVFHACIMHLPNHDSSKETYQNVQQFTTQHHSLNNLVKFENPTSSCLERERERERDSIVSFLVVTNPRFYFYSFQSIFRYVI